MYRTIKKHPFAFLHCLSWLCMGFCMGYIMHHDSSDYYDVPYADTIVILFIASVAFIVLTPLVGMIVKRIRRPDPATRKERRFLQAAAKWFESTQPGFGWFYLTVLVLAVVLPFLAFLSVGWLDLYMPAALFAAIGISIWLCFLYHEWPEKQLLKVTDTADRFHIQSGAGPSLLDDLCESNNTYGMTQSQWNSRRDHLYNMFLQEGMVSERSTITVHSIPMTDIASHFGLTDPATDENEMLWIPFSQFALPQSTKGLAAIKKLFSQRLTALADQRYATNRESDSGSYPFSSTDVRLEPDDSATLCEIGSELHLFATTATNPVPGNDLIYRGCMLRIENAMLSGVKWDHFEELNEGDDREYYLSSEEAHALFRLVLEGAFTYEICSLTYLEEKRQLALEIWAEPEDRNGLPLKGEAASFAFDDGLGYLLLLSYDRLRWHWMKAAPAEPHFFYY